MRWAGRARCARHVSMRAGLTAGDLGEDVDLAVGVDGLVERVLEDLAVDGDGHALGQVRGEGRVALGQQLEQMLDGGRREVEARDASRDLREVADQHHPGHGGDQCLCTPPLVEPFSVFALGLLSPLACRAFSTFGGDIGSSVKRMPVAFSMALAMAAMGGTMGVSPMPRTPYGWRGLGTSTMIASIIGRSEATGIR